METPQEKFDRLKPISESVKGFLSFMIMVGFALIILSPLVFIWGTFVAALKIALTGVWMVVVFKLGHLTVLKSMEKVEKSLKDKQG
jgi:hypothetical protein